MEPLTEEQKALAERALSRANEIADRYAKSFPRHADDLASAAAWGVMKAALNYVQGENDTWDWWSASMARFECLQFIKSPVVQRQQTWSERGEDSPYEEVDAPEQTYIEPFLEEGIESILRHLPAKHRALCDMVYTAGLTAETAAVELGFSPKHGHKIHREAIEMLRERFSA